LSSLVGFLTQKKKNKSNCPEGKGKGKERKKPFLKEEPKVFFHYSNASAIRKTTKAMAKRPKPIPRYPISSSMTLSFYFRRTQRP
jgi:hypothetical protein